MRQRVAVELVVVKAEAIATPSMVRQAAAVVALG
jgi:hypothetical protein